MLQLLIKPLLGVAGQAVSGFIETKKAKAERKLERRIRFACPDASCNFGLRARNDGARGTGL